MRGVAIGCLFAVAISASVVIHGLLQPSLLKDDQREEFPTIIAGHAMATDFFRWPSSQSSSTRAEVRRGGQRSSLRCGAASAKAVAAPDAYCQLGS